MGFTTTKARDQAERILEFVALGADGAAVLASASGELIASSRRKHHTYAADELARAAVAKGGALPVQIEVHGLSRSTVLVIASNPTIAFGLLEQRTARALRLLRRMLGPTDGPAGSGAPAEVGQRRHDA